MCDDFGPDTASFAPIVGSSASEGEAEAVLGVDRMGSEAGVEVEDVGSPPNDVDPSLEKDPMAQRQPLEAPIQDQARPIADREGHQPLQLDTAEDERPVVRGRCAGLACLWIDHCCEATTGVP